MSEFTCGSGAAESAGAGERRAEADCAEVIAEVWTLLDGECTQETRHKLRQHLEECPECLRHYGLEERVKALIATKCRSEKAPEGFRERLRLEISRTTIIRGR
jgi:anti-sigma factor (TIGR02949 family)